MSVLFLCSHLWLHPAARGQEENVANAGQDGTQRYLVRLQDGMGAEMARRPGLMGLPPAEAGREVIRSIPRFDLLAMRLDSRGYERMRSHPLVEVIEPDPVRSLSAQITPYGIPMVEGNLLTDLPAGDMTVCIIDSGYDLDHEDLGDNRVTGTDIYGSGEWYVDTNKHGTHVAGTIAAFNNDLGVVGLLPNGNVKLHVVRVFDQDGNAYLSDILAGLEVCAGDAVGADVVNMSFGGDSFSTSEEQTFRRVADSGVLLVAAAGNDGTTAKSYPASYDSVISVAAVDRDRSLASFSQRNDQVELAAPGVKVISTVPTGTGILDYLMVEGVSREAESLTGSPDGEVEAPLSDCGLGLETCPGAEGTICLIERGTSYFWQKVQACENGGGLGAVIYNYEPGIFLGTLDGRTTFIPSVSISRENGLALRQSIGETAYLGVAAIADYEKMNGTSMATPHVAGAAALAWSYFRNTCSAEDVRTALQASAEDLGVEGRDTSFGYGLVQAVQAKMLLAGGCGADTLQHADFDGDGDVDGRDLHAFAGLMQGGEPAADLDRDGVVAGGDLSLFASVFGSF